MKVGLNVLHLVPGETGGSEIYARRLIPALLETGEAELTLFASREAAPVLRGESWASMTEVVELPVRTASRGRRVFAEQTELPRAARSSGIELLHNLFTTAPVVSGVPQVTTILDLIYKRFPKAHSGVRSLGMRVLVPLAARRSRRIIAISESTKADVVSFLGVEPSRIDVTYLGPGRDSEVEPASERALRDRYSLGDDPIILSVSAHRPHKNLDRLINAIAALDERAVLVIPGYETQWEGELSAHVRNLGATDRVRFLGWVGEAELEGLYAAASCMVFPSLAEGFGLPVLEAMARGVPVACSNATALPEVGGEAALYFDPLDVTAMTASIETLLRDASLGRHLASAGRKQAAQFTWEKTARETLDSYERAVLS